MSEGQVMEKLGDLNKYISGKIQLALFHCGCDAHLKFTFHFHALEKEMATHSSVLAWRIPMDRGAWWATDHRVTKSWT